MAFSITFKKCLSEKNKLDKTFADQTLAIAGTLRDETSLIDPVILCQLNPSNFSGYNYMEIPPFGRSYFITNIIQKTVDLCEVHAHVDVLSSFKDGIRSNSAIIRRQAKNWNLYLNDGSFRTYQNPIILTKEFPAGFNAMEFVLAIAGN